MRHLPLRKALRKATGRKARTVAAIVEDKHGGLSLHITEGVTVWKYRAMLAWARDQIGQVAKANGEKQDEDGYAVGAMVERSGPYAYWDVSNYPGVEAYTHFGFAPKD
jgi:hypothetical protein